LMSQSLTSAQGSTPRRSPTQRRRAGSGCGACSGVEHQGVPARVDARFLRSTRCFNGCFASCPPSGRMTAAHPIASVTGALAAAVSTAPRECTRSTTGTDPQSTARRRLRFGAWWPASTRFRKTLVFCRKVARKTSILASTQPARRSTAMSRSTTALSSRARRHAVVPRPRDNDDRAGWSQLPSTCGQGGEVHSTSKSSSRRGT